ncbi:hypothetical protein V3H18_05530 [Methylocystis sp. 9N]|uniref:DUF3617 family protein n=1 Tax=Methylocystis borbori TaxID=3118750 RepID=A0ABU7XHI6_9HYPH
MRRALAIIAALAAAPIHAASVDKDTPAGRYAIDAASCKAKDYFVTVTAKETVLPTFSCKDVSYDQTENKGGRAVYQATSSKCFGEESVQPRKESFTLIVDAAGLQIVWSDGSKSAVFARCPERP